MALNVPGGTPEANSIYFGFRFLYVLAAAIYLAAMVCAWFAGRNARPSP